VVAFARPWVDLFTPEVQARGAHLIIAKVPRIPEESIDPTVKNFHWGDSTRGLFEAHTLASTVRFSSIAADLSPKVRATTSSRSRRAKCRRRIAACSRA
jgi:hypothetical protein